VDNIKLVVDLQNWWDMTWISITDVLNSDIKMIKLNIITIVYHIVETVVVSTYDRKRMASVCFDS
jgi:hypothetical protein